MRSLDRSTAIRGARRSLALVLTGVLVATSVAVPLLDHDRGARTPALETEHHPGTCAVGHDHRICILAAASLWLGADDDHRPVGRLEPRSIAAPPVPEPSFQPTATLHHSRAPPVA